MSEEVKTKHGEWKGKRLFCCCDGVEWPQSKGRGADAIGTGQICPGCNMFPWYYLNPDDEPRKRPAPDRAETRNVAQVEDCQSGPAQRDSPNNGFGTDVLRADHLKGGK